MSSNLDLIGRVKAIESFVGGSSPYSNVDPAMAYSANPLHSLKGAIQFTRWSGIAAPAGRGTRLFTAAAGWLYVLSRVEVPVGFTSSSGAVTNVVLELGSVSGPALAGMFQILPYSGLQMAGGGIIGAGSMAIPSAVDLDIYAKLSVINASPGNLSTLTAGTVIITVCGMLLP